jgi:hypothetical protein
MDSDTEHIPYRRLVREEDGPGGQRHRAEHPRDAIAPATVHRIVV